MNTPLQGRGDVFTTSIRPCEDLLTLHKAKFFFCLGHQIWWFLTKNLNVWQPSLHMGYVLFISLYTCWNGLLILPPPRNTYEKHITAKQFRDKTLLEKSTTSRYLLLLNLYLIFMCHAGSSTSWIWTNFEIRFPNMKCYVIGRYLLFI